MLAQQRGESWRKPKPRVGGEGGSSLDEVASAGYCRIGRARCAKREGTREEPVLLRLFIHHQLKSGGYGLGCGAHLRPSSRSQATPVRVPPVWDGRSR